MKKGSTLIELIVYIGIVTIVLLVAMDFVWQVIYGDVKIRSLRETQQNARFAMEKIVRIIKSASGINSPTAGNSSDSISLKMADSNLNPTTIKVSDAGEIQVTQGTNDSYELTNKRVIVDNLKFTNVSSQGTPGAVRIEMAVKHANPSGRNEYKALINLVSTASLLEGGASGSGTGNCQGTATPCDNFNDQDSCNNQKECSWNDASCTGDCTKCKELDFWQCIFQQGCNFDFRKFKCRGKCTSCDDISNQTLCNVQLGCSWQDAYCSGAATPCQDFTTEETCVSQSGCQWVTQ